MSIIDQLAGAQGNAGGGSRSEGRGVTLARVTNITDPDSFNRVKCLRVGAKNEEETDWCYVMTPAGGTQRGFFWFPQVDDLVVLAYLDNDPHRPLVIGGLWTTEVKPPYTIQDGKVQEYSLKTPSGIELLLHDEDKKQKATLTMPSGTVLTLDDENQKISVQDKNGDNALTMDVKGGNASLKAKTKIELAAGDTKVTLESSGNITAKGSGKLSLQGTDAEIKASSQLAMQGATATLKSNGTMEVSASGPTTIKGAVVKIN